MMNIAAPQKWPAVSEADGLLIYVAQRIQITRTQHEKATQNFNALCRYVDREGSPLQGKVLECYPSGSFATGTAIVSKARTSRHDVDAVLELDVPTDAPPKHILQLLFDAINAEKGSRYNGRVTLNSRCVTVEYEDGTTVDLMPVARFQGGPERAGNLFHHKPETRVTYHKPVNPWGFADHFNTHVEFDPDFVDLFRGQRVLAEGRIVDRADTQPMPDHQVLEEKSPRVVALQLIKRKRDLSFRPRQGWYKPTSVALGTMALEAGPVQRRLVDEVISIAAHMRMRLAQRNGPRGCLHVVNPAYPVDVLTDRWPENFDRQRQFDNDLQSLIIDMRRLRDDDLSMAEKQEILQRNFGQTAARDAIDRSFDVAFRQNETKGLPMGNKGRVLLGAGVVAPSIVTVAARAATRSGGFLED